MPILNLTPTEFKLFLLIFTRVSIVLILFPVFGGPVFPNVVKIGLSLLIAFALFPAVKIDPALFPENTVALGILLGAELITGLVLGLSVRLFFSAVQLAGQLISFQMGFAVINVLDPQTGAQVSIMDQIGYWIVMLVFLLLDGHHFFIAALAESFKVVDVGTVFLKEGLFTQMMNITTDMFVLSIKIGAPAIVALLFVSAAFGLSAKFAPQMNILIAAFPVKIIVGLFFFGITLDIILIMTRAYVDRLGPLLSELLIWLGGT